MFQEHPSGSRYPHALSMEQVGEKIGEGGDVRDEEDTDAEHDDDRQCGAKDFGDGFAVAEFHVGQEDDAETDWIDSVGGSEGNEERHFDDDGGIDFHEAADDEEEKIQEQEEEERRVDGAGGPFDGVGRNFGVDKVVREAERNTQDEENTADEQAG